MINIFEVNETNKMIEQENLDVYVVHLTEESLHLDFFSDVQSRTDLQIQRA